MSLKVPQTRDCKFYPRRLEKGLRSERALLLAIAERYVQGVSTRRVKQIVEQLCGMAVSSTQVSRAAGLDGLLPSWRQRVLGCYRYILLDARYEKVRRGGQGLDAAVLIAGGVDAEGKRDVLGCSVSLSEAEVHWRTFLSARKDCGLYGIELVVSDTHDTQPPAPAANNESGGAPERGNSATYSGGETVPQRGFMPPLGECGADGDRGGLADR